MNEDASVFLERRSYRLRRLRDAAKFLPFLGLVLWLVPLLWPVEGADAASNAMALQYIFGVWAVLIAVVFVISQMVSLGDHRADKAG